MFAAIALALLLVVALSSLPYNTLTMYLPRFISPDTLVPQGWGFFTRNPKEPYLLMFRMFKGRWTVWNKSQASFSLGMGLSRKARRENMEMGSFADLVKEDQWTECKGPPPSCVPETIHRIKNPLKDKALITGDLLLVSIEPTPWAWSNSKNKIVMPSKVVRLYVE